MEAHNSEAHGPHLNSRGVDVKLPENCEGLLKQLVTDGNICYVWGIVVVKAINVLHNTSSVSFNGRQNEQVLQVSAKSNTFNRL